MKLCLPTACHLILCQRRSLPGFDTRLCQCTNTFCVRMTNKLAFVSLCLGNVTNLCFFAHPTNGFPSEMAIATVLGGDSRIFSGGSRHKGPRVGFLVRLRHHLLGRGRATHPRHPSEHRSLGKHFRCHRSKCEHLAARSKHLSCVARVLGALPQDEQWTPSDLLWSDAPPPKLTLETQRAALGIPGKLYKGIARLKQHSRPAVLGTGLRLPPETREPSHVDARDPDHQRQEAHGALRE